MKKWTHLSIVSCAFSTFASASSSAQNESSVYDTTKMVENSSPQSVKLELEDKNVLVIQNEPIIVQKENQNSSRRDNDIKQDIQPATSPTPPAMIVLGYGAEPFITVDYLYWTARQDNMEFIFKYRLDADGNTIGKSKVKAPDWDYESGFRIGVGLDFKHDGWDTYLNYTRFHPDTAKKSESVEGTASSTNRLVPAWPLNSSTSLSSNLFLAEASGNWKFQYDDLVWELGRNFFISRHLTLRPFTGLETSWQTQKQNLFFDQPGSTHRQYFMSNSVHFCGIGIRTGLDTAWYVYKKNLSIIADLSLSGLWSRTRTTQKQTNLNLTSDISTLSLDLHNSFHSIRFVIDWLLGMQWESWFYDNRMKFSLSAAWEEQVWINQNALPEILFPLNYKARGGDLSIEGLTIRARFDF